MRTITSDHPCTAATHDFTRNANVAAKRAFQSFGQGKETASVYIPAGQCKHEPPDEVRLPRAASRPVAYLSSIPAESFIKSFHGTQPTYHARLYRYSDVSFHREIMVDKIHAYVASHG